MPREKKTCQSAGHRSRLPQVTVCLNYFHFAETVPHFRERGTQTNKVLRRYVCVFLWKILIVLETLITSTADREEETKKLAVCTFRHVFKKTTQTQMQSNVW